MSIDSKDHTFTAEIIKWKIWTGQHNQIKHKPQLEITVTCLNDD